MVATPIGNLKDISFRALETFQEADFIACEDTRHTLGLLTHYEISKPLISCRAVNEAAASEKIVKLLDEGKKVFEGFLSPKAGKRKRRLQELFDFGAGFVLYESPYRIVKLLADIAEIDSSRELIVGRELTKLHEEIIKGPASEVLQNFEKRLSIKGEFSVFVTGK